MSLRKMGIGALVLAAAWFAADACAHTAADVCPVPAGERIFEGFAVKVDGVEAPVSEARCSAMPFNRRWPGHQRSTDQTELTGFVRFAFDGRAHLAVTAAKDFSKVKVRPLSRKVEVVRKGRTVEFDITRPGGYSVEFDGCHGNLHVFADAPKDYGIRAGAAGVRSFGPGEHDVGAVELKSGETVYIDPGAVVYGRFWASNATDVAILGRGIIDASRVKERILFSPKGDEGWENAIENAERYHTLWMRDVRNLRIDGVTVRDSLAYNVALFDCEDVRIEGVKIVGQWRYNTDGIDLHNCRRATVRGCFVRSYDDTLCAKSHHEWPSDTEDILFENCVLWNDWGKTLEVGAECQSDRLTRITFRDCDVIHACGNVMDISNVDYGEVSEVRYEDIRIEDDEPMPLRQYQKSEDMRFDPTQFLDAVMAFSANLYFCAYSTERGFTYRGAGQVRGVTLRNIDVTTSRGVRTRITGFDADHRVSGVAVDGFRVNGRAAKGAADLGLGEFRFADAPVFRDASDAVRWYDGRDLSLEGRAFADTCGPYERLPATASNRVPEMVWDYQRDSAGMQFRFRSATSRLRLSWSLLKGTLGSHNLSWNGKSGVDVYRRAGRDWIYVGTGRVSNLRCNAAEFAWNPGDEGIVYLPSYDSVGKIEIGVDAGTTLEPAPARASGIVRPVVFYGTSITQGACASRPGMAYANIAGRRGDFPVVNLGFSGAGKMEDAMCDLVGDVDASCYVLDTAWNMTRDLIAERWERFARRLHARRPDVPILFAEPCHTPPFETEMVARGRLIRAIHDKLRAEDPKAWANLYLITDREQIPDDPEATADGVHPSDLGMSYMGRAFADRIVRILRGRD